MSTFALSWPQLWDLDRLGGGLVSDAAADPVVREADGYNCRAGAGAAGKCGLSSGV